jgi:hypothetical protein
MQTPLIKTKNEIIENSLKRDSSLISSLTITSSQEIASTLNLLEIMLKTAKDAETKKNIQTRINDLHNITLMRVDLTKAVLKQADIKEVIFDANTQLELNFVKTEEEEISDRQINTELKPGPKVIKHDFKKSSKPSFPPIGAGKVSFQLREREGKPNEVTINRFKVYGTEYRIPETAQRILANNVNTQSKIRELILEIHRWGLTSTEPFISTDPQKMRDELMTYANNVAINLYLDIVCERGIDERKNTIEYKDVLTPEIALEQYLDEIMPWVNKTLEEELNPNNQEALELERAKKAEEVKDIADVLFADYNEIGYISKAMKIKLENSPCKRWADPTLKYEGGVFPINARVRLTSLLKDAKINPTDFIVEDAASGDFIRIYHWVNHIKNAEGYFVDRDKNVLVELPKLSYLQVEEMVKQLIREGQKENAFLVAVKYLEHAQYNTTDQTGGFGVDGLTQVFNIWVQQVNKEIENPNNNSANTPEHVQTPEVIETKINENEKQGLDKLTEFIRERVLKQSLSVVNEARQFIKKAGENGKRLRLPEGIKIEKIYREVKNELADQYSTDPSMPSEDQRIFKRYSVKETNPELWAEAQALKDGPFKLLMNLATSVTFDRNNYLDAINLVMDMVAENESKSWSFCKGWDEDRWKQWFKEAIYKVEKVKEEPIKPNVEFENQKQETKEEVKTEPVTTEEIKTEVKKTESEEKVYVIDEKIDKVYNCISGEKDSKVLKGAISKFLSLDYLTPKERFDIIVNHYLNKNKRWLRQPVSERERFVNGIIDSSKTLEEMFKTPF